MILYKFQTPIKGTSIEKDLIDHCGESDLFRSVYRQTPGMMRSINEHFLIDFKHDRKALPLLVDADSKYLYGAAAVSPEAGTADVALEMVSKSISGCSFINTCEISREEYMEMIELSSAEEFLNTSVRNIFDQISLYYTSRRGLFEETPFEVTEEFDPDGIISYAEAKRRSAEILASDDFKEEIDRIYSRKNLRKYMGHPVHYVISAGDYAAAMDMIHILVPALRKCNRLLSGRVSQMRKINQRAYRDEGFERFFESESGATVVIDFSGDDTSGNMASSFVDLSRAFARMVEKYGKDTLFIFVDVSNKSELTGAAIQAIQSCADMVHLTEGYGSRDEAAGYLRNIASRAPFNLISDDEVARFLPDDKISFTVTDIYTAYNNWYAKGLKSHVYRAYAEVDTLKILPSKKEDHPYEELQKLIGLEDVKKVCDQILNSYRLEKMKELMGMETPVMSRHMLFSGNPGTCKTTVARLLAQILKEEGILKNGHIVECGRQDLVDMYVGWTAKKVEQKFREARGGILFIDEAYSLVDHYHKSFGTEAINTIVQLMENYRNEVIVIFAGYSDKMKEFLAENEGLNSRIAFHLNFPDYSADELEGIMELMLQKQDLVMDDDAKAKCLDIFREARTYRNFGNGRFVRNLVEQTRLNQAARIMSTMKGDMVDRSVVNTLTADDVTMPYIAARKSSRMGL